MLKGKKTYLGIALTAVIGLAAIFGIEPAAESPAWLDAALMLAASAFAAYGRRVAQPEARE